jgi:hypothetical protein
MAITELTKRLTSSLEQLFNTDEWVTAREVRIRGCEGIPDIIAIRKRQYLRKELRAYEIKASRADFLADVGRMKWKKYLSVCHRVYFAAPAGMLKRSEIPQGAGLIVFSENSGWSVVKTAKSHEPTNLDADAVLSILFAASNDADERRRLRDRLTVNDNISLKGVADRIGGEIARRVAGCTPETERDAERIARVVNQYFGNKVEAIKALKFAASLSKEAKLVGDISKFLRELTDSINPTCVKRAANKIRVLENHESTVDADIVADITDSDPEPGDVEDAIGSFGIDSIKELLRTKQAEE